MKFLSKKFEELSPHELYQILKLRADVFVVEQKCAYADPDGKDEKALHIMGWVDGTLAAYTRCFPPGAYFKEAAIGRVVVNPAFRGNNYGKAVMEESIGECIQKFGNGEIIISAQLYLERFYTELGFIREGDVYPEDDIPHIKMRRSAG